MGSIYHHTSVFVMTNPRLHYDQIFWREPLSPFLNKLDSHPLNFLFHHLVNSLDKLVDVYANDSLYFKHFWADWLRPGSLYHNCRLINYDNKQPLCSKIVQSWLRWCNYSTYLILWYVFLITDRLWRCFICTMFLKMNTIGNFNTWAKYGDNISAGIW